MIQSSFSMIQNFISYMKHQTEEHQEILSELNKLKYYKCRSYSARLVRYALQLRHTSLQAYKLLSEELPLPSLS